MRYSLTMSHCLSYFYTFSCSYSGISLYDEKPGGGRAGTALVPASHSNHGIPLSFHDEQLSLLLITLETVSTQFNGTSIESGAQLNQGCVASDRVFPSQIVVLAWHRGPM